MHILPSVETNRKLREIQDTEIYADAVDPSPVTFMLKFGINGKVKDYDVTFEDGNIKDVQECGSDQMTDDAFAVRHFLSDYFYPQPTYEVAPSAITKTNLWAMKRKGLANVFPPLQSLDFFINNRRVEFDLMVLKGEIDVPWKGAEYSEEEAGAVKVFLLNFFKNPRSE